MTDPIKTDVILNGPDYFECDRQRARIKKLHCVEYQRDGYRPSCQKCDQGKKIAGDYLKDHEVSKEKRRFVPLRGYVTIENKGEVKSMDDQRTKICSKCGEEKPLKEEFFYKHPLTKDGYDGQCRACKEKYRREYRKRKKTRPGKIRIKKKKDIIAVKLVLNMDPFIEALQRIKQAAQTQIDGVDQVMACIEKGQKKSELHLFKPRE